MALQVLKGMTLENVTARAYQQITSQVGYDVLATVNNNPAIMVTNTGSQKMAVISFSLHYSNLAIRKEFPILMSNMFAYFFPTMVENADVQVGDSLEMNSMSEHFEVFYPITVLDGENLVFDMGDTSWIYSDEESTGFNFHISMNLTIPGSYKITQNTYFGRNFDESIFVSIPSVESNIWLNAEMTAPVADAYETEFFEDWLLYLAAVLVFLLFAEWWLHTRENAM